jgi:hypothetical protein
MVMMVVTLKRQNELRLSIARKEDLLLDVIVEPVIAIRVPSIFVMKLGRS